MPKTQIADDVSYLAFLINTDGNNVKLHSQTEAENRTN